MLGWRNSTRIRSAHGAANHRGDDALPTMKLEDLDVLTVGGVPFRVSGLDEAVSLLIQHVTSGADGIPVRLANSYCVTLANSDVAYRTVLDGAGVNLPDGAPVVALMRWARKGSAVGRPRRVRVPHSFPRHWISAVTSGTTFSGRMTRRCRL